VASPAPTPDQLLDQAVIDAGRQLAELHLRDGAEQDIEAARAALIAAREARYPDA
jgi:hypothetical protein